LALLADTPNSQKCITTLPCYRMAAKNAKTIMNIANDRF